MNILLLGIPGSGKTSLATHVCMEQLCLAYYEPAGDRKKALLEQLNILKPLHSLNQVESLLINALYYEKIKWNPDANHPGRENDWGHFPLLIDTHASYALPDGSFVDLLPNTFKADALILLEAAPDTIRSRRIDRGRNRDAVLASFVERELEEERSKTLAYKTKKRIPLLAIDNTDDWQYAKVVEFIKETTRNWSEYK